MTVWHQSYRKNIPLDKARAWAKWLATRYADAPNVLWSTTPEAKKESVPILREIAAGLRQGDPLHRPISFKPDPAPAPSSSFINEEPWLDFNAMQVWNALDKIYPMLTADYALKPVKPTLMAEGAYEAGEEYGFAVTPLWVPWPLEQATTLQGSNKQASTIRTRDHLRMTYSSTRDRGRLRFADHHSALAT